MEGEGGCGQDILTTPYGKAFASESCRSFPLPRDLHNGVIRRKPDFRLCLKSAIQKNSLAC